MSRLIFDDCSVLSTKRDIFYRAFVVEQGAIVVTHSARIFGYPDDAAIFPIDLRFEVSGTLAQLH